MATLKSCKDCVANDIASRHRDMVVFMPPKVGKTLDLFSVCQFELELEEPRVVGTWLSDCGHEEEWKDVVNQITDEEIPDYNFVTRRDKASYAGLSSSEHGHAGLKALSDVDITVEITKIQHHFMKDRSKAAYEFVKKYVCSFAESDARICSMLDNRHSLGVGHVNLVIGFPCDKWEGFCNKIQLDAAGEKDFGIGLKTSFLQANIGAGLDDKKSLDLKDMEGVFGANYIVVHLCQVYQGSLYGTQTNTRLMRSPIFVDKLDDKALLAMYYNAFPSLISVQQKLPGRRLGGIFRKLGSAAQTSTSAQQELWKAGAAMYKEGLSDGSDVAVDGDVAVAVTTTERPDPDSSREGNIQYLFYNSFNCVIRTRKDAVDQARATLLTDGQADLCGMAVKAISAFYDMDMAQYLPIYFNEEMHSQVTTTFPSTVICYDSGTRDHWCFRPVDSVPQNNEVVTIYTSDWKLRESVVVLRDNDTVLQGELESIGFHILKMQQFGFTFSCSEDSVVMGRHELSHISVSGTTIPGIEFRDGFLCKTEDSKVASSAPRPSGSEAPSLYSVPTDSPNRKKMKM